MTQAALEEREQALAEAAASASLVSGLQKEVEMLRKVGRPSREESKKLRSTSSGVHIVSNQVASPEWPSLIGFVAQY